jgi:hypothetical protein
LSQKVSVIEEFIYSQDEFILKKAHTNSKFISSEVIVEEKNISDADYRIVLTIHYKGFWKNHILKCFIYWEDYPQKFIWGSNTNTFKIKTDPVAVLEELRENWNKWKK